MCLWSLVTMWLMSEGHYKIGWRSSILSQFGWAWLAYDSQMWGMLAYCSIMVVVCIRAMRKMSAFDRPLGR
jgi:hypothetical protein